MDSEGRSEGRHESFVAHAQKVGSIVAVCLVIWLVTGAGYFWPGWVIAFSALKLGAHARRAYQSQPDSLEV